MDSVNSLLSKYPEISLTNDDKLCYIRLALAKLLGHLFHKKVDEIDAETFENLEDRVVIYSLDLIEVDFDNPEPYLFYLLLTWPYLDEDEDFKVEPINEKY
jgi:hypothetical protein